ncbi:MAG: MFS transporter [Thermoleophilia bacterium]|nr:MFS transporter [Thermoleophilia bacterium]
MTDAYPVRRNALLLAAGLVCLSGMFQLAVAVATVTLVLVTGIEGILGLGPAIFLTASALAAGPAGRAMDRFGRMPVIRVGFAAGIAGGAVTAAGCALDSAALVIAGFALAGGASGIVLLSRAAAAEMFPPERRGRGMALVLFGAVFGALLGPLVFGPLFAGKELETDALVVPWLVAGGVMIVGLVFAFAVRPDPKTIAGSGEAERAAAPLGRIVRRPGVPTALLAAVTSFAVMVGVMNLTGYVAIGHGHEQSDVFHVISAHIVGMYGLVLVVGDVVDRVGRHRAIVVGLLLMSASTLGLVWLQSIAGMSVALFGLGLGWNLSYVAATTELVSLTAASERGRLVGFSDLLSGLAGAGLALVGGVTFAETGANGLALGGAVLAAVPALWIFARRAAPTPTAEPAA